MGTSQSIAGFLSKANPNSYYVSKEFLSNALKAVTGTLCHLTRGDKVALYTTHCTHPTMAGTLPDMMYPLRLVDGDTARIFRDLATEIDKCGTQAWDPPRPNPTMADVVIAILKSLGFQDVNYHRTHVVLLSPTMNAMHRLSGTFPSVHVHQINAGSLPYSPGEEQRPRVCPGTCCKNVSITNWTHFQSTSGRIRQIIRYGRCEKPVGEITNVGVDIRMREGCRILEQKGSSDIDCLRAGQIHTLYLRVRVDLVDAQEPDIDSFDAGLDAGSYLDDLKQDLRNCKTLGASKVHVLTVQVTYHNTLHPKGCWNYFESHLLLVKDLGRLSVPNDMAPELYQRLLFSNLCQLGAREAKKELEKLAMSSLYNKLVVRKILEPMAREIYHRMVVLEYEMSSRQKIPSCPGPIDISAAPHEWLIEKWNAKKNKRKGMAVV